MQALQDSPLASILMVVAFVVIAIVGGIVTIIEPDTLAFDQYIGSLSVAAAGLGLLGIGRGINSGQKHVAQAELARTGPLPPPVEPPPVTGTRAERLR